MDNVFVIGDVHGNLDRLEALLRQEGLLDRCLDCDGSGMDAGVGPSDCYPCRGLGWARLRPEVTVIQIGDLGHFGEGGSPTGDLLCYKYVTENRWCDVVLWGNHDRAIVDSTHAFTGYISPGREIEYFINELHRTGRLMLAIDAHDFLITHAGLALAFKQQKVPDELKTDLTKLVDWLNDEDEKYLETGKCDPQAWGIRDAVGRKRGGSSSVGGILWRDSTERLYDGFRQIFGHSADHRKRQVRYAWRSTTQRVSTKGQLQRKSPPSYCIDIGGKAKHGQKGACLAGIWLPSEKIVRVDL